MYPDPISNNSNGVLHQRNHASHTDCDQPLSSQIMNNYLLHTASVPTSIFWRTGSVLDVAYNLTNMSREARDAR